jgi:hypothetical protein
MCSFFPKKLLLLLMLLLLLCLATGIMCCSSAVQVLARRDWRCPCCRDICNCSGQNCQRSRRGLKDTKMLWHEARNLGYKSVRQCL